MNLNNWTNFFIFKINVTLGQIIIRYKVCKNSSKQILKLLTLFIEPLSTYCLKNVIKMLNYGSSVLDNG